MTRLNARLRDNQKIYSLKYNVVTKLFDLKIGEERRTIGGKRSVLKDLREEKLDISDSQWEEILTDISGVKQEHLFEAMLTSVAFRESVEELIASVEEHEEQVFR